MRRLTRLFLVLVLGLDVFFVGLLLTGNTTQIFAQETADARPSDPDRELESAAPPVPVQTRWTREALQLLGRELTARAQELDKRQLELEEMARSVEVLKRASAEDAVAGGNSTVPDSPASESVPVAQQRPGLDATTRQEMFTRLRKTYENMEPESAATALSRLAVLDKGAVIELMLGWKPSVAGAVLDALTLSDPALAADLSYGIWLRSGKNKPDAGS